MPFSPRSAVDAELDRHQKEDNLKPTQHSEWVTLLVLVEKGNVELPLCGDYRSTVNATSQKVAYPHPMAEEAVSQPQGSEITSILDFTAACQQLLVIL